MDRGALQDALKTGGRFRVLDEVRDQHFQLAVEIPAQFLAEFVDIHAAGAQHGNRVVIVAQRV